MKIKTVTSALALLACSAPGLALAKEHQAIITGLGFFSATTYVQPGDTVQFTTPPKTRTIWSGKAPLGN